MSQAPPQSGRGGCLSRLASLAVAWVSASVAVYLLLPPALVSQGLESQFDPATYNLTEPALVNTWRALIAMCAGLALVVVMLLGIGVGWLSRRRAQRQAVPDALRQLRRGVQRRDAAQVGLAAEAVGFSLGDEAVPELLAALDAGFDDDTRRRIAAALFRLGRAVTAEVELMPR